MKKIASILLLALLLYNAFGYYITFAYEREQARVTMLQDLPESAFEVIKINAAIYTSVENTDFEYIDQEMALEGKNYHFVKKRIFNDTLNLYYVHNYRQDALQQNLNDIVETQTLTKQTNGDTPVKQLLKNFLKDYIPNDIYVLVVGFPIKITEFIKINTDVNACLTSPYLSLHSPPPEVA